MRGQGSIGEEGLLVGRDVPGLAAPGEAGSRRLVARVRVVAVLRVVQLRARHRSVELLDGRRRAVHDRGAGVDDGVERRRRLLRADDPLGTGRLPEAAVADGVVLDRAGVLARVGAAEVERRAGRGEVEAEHAGGDGACADRAVEPRVLQNREEEICQNRLVEYPMEYPNGIYPMRETLTVFRFEIEENARPKMPSMGSPWNELESVVTGENSWFLTVNPATVTGKGPPQ